MSSRSKSKSRPRRRRQGKGIKDVLNKVHKFIKANKVISRGLSAYSGLSGGTLPGASYASRAADVASQLGYGRRIRRRRRRM